MSVESMTRSFQRKDDPLDIRIRKLISEHVYSGEVGKEMMEKSYELQLQYYKDCLENLENSDYVFERNQQVLKDLSKATSSRIVSGEEFLSQVPEGKPVFAIVNHFSIYKLTSIEQKELGIETEEIDDIPPPPIHFSAVYPVAERLNDNLFDAHIRLPDPLGKIQDASGFILVDKDEKGQYERILERSKEHVQKFPNSVTVIFAEGETSGKKSQRGPFDLEPFHGGSFAIAEELGITVLPVAQYFNPNTGFELGVFKPIDFTNIPPETLPQERKSFFKDIATKTQEDMQAWLDKKQAK